MKHPVRLVTLYAAFAAIAIGLNLVAQVLVIALYSAAYAVTLSMVVGTGTGLLVKYVLDKRHIFAYETENLAHDGRLFVLYSLMGVVTTALFWGVEWAFQWLFDSNAMRYLGGGIGLVVGYVIKYHLDKEFVFIDQPTEAASS